MDFLSTIEPSPTSEPTSTTTEPPITILDEPISEVIPEEILLEANDASLLLVDQTSLVPDAESSAAIEIDPPIPVHSPIDQDDSIFEIAED